MQDTLKKYFESLEANKEPLKVNYTKYLTNGSKFLTEEIEVLNKDLLMYLFNNFDNSLIKAQAGGGKTFTTIEVFKELSKLSKEKTFLLLVPTTEQAKQASKEYDIPYYIGTTKKGYNSPVSVCVYDSLNKFLELNNLRLNKNIVLMIDEAHKLINDYNFRKKAIKKITEIAKQATTFYMTATPEAIEKFNFNFWVEFIDLNKSKNFKECYFYDYEESKTKELLRLINRIQNQQRLKNQKILIFNDNKEENRIIEKVLKSKYKNKKVAQLNADNKTNKFMEAIRDKSLLVGADIFLSTAILEQGTNINNDEPIIVIYLMDNKNYSYTKLLQSVARPRKTGHILFLLRKGENNIVSSDSYLNIELIREQLLQEINFLNEVKRLEKTFNNINIDNSKLKNIFDIKATKKISLGFDIYNCIVYNQETELYELDENLVLRVEHLEKDKIDFNNNQNHIIRAKKAIKAEQFLFLTKSTSNKELEEAYKEEAERARELKKENLELTLGLITTFRDNEIEGLKEYVNFGSHAPYNMLTTEQKKTIEQISKTPRVAQLIASLYEIDPTTEIKELIINNNFDILELEKYIRVENNKEFNKLVPKGAISSNNKEILSKRAQLRKLIDENIGKELNKKIELQMYKIYNPIKKRELTDKQRQKLFDILQEFCKVYFKKDNRIKITNLLL